MLRRKTTPNNFRIRLCSDVDYEGMVADICYKDCTVATVIEEKDPNKIRIKIFSPPKGEESWEFLVDDFIEYLEKAKKVLALPVNE